MMIGSFAQIQEQIANSGVRKTIVLAAAHDEAALAGLARARRAGFARAVLLGRRDEITGLLERLGEAPADYEIADVPDDEEAAARACAMVARGEADIPMKGLMQTKTFVRALLDKRCGFLKEGALISQATLFEYPAQRRMMLLTDCAVNIAPDCAAKAKILQNAVAFARLLGEPSPKVAVLAALEKVNPAMPATLDADALTKAAQRGEFGDCAVYGPLALDNALDERAAALKGIVSDVPGHADILLAPDLQAGNLLTKALTFFAGYLSAGCVCGVETPVIMTSRTDNDEDKYASILAALYCSLAPSGEKR